MRQHSSYCVQLVLKSSGCNVFLVIKLLFVFWGFWFKIFIYKNYFCEFYSRHKPCIFLWTTFLWKQVVGDNFGFEKVLNEMFCGAKFLNVKKITLQFFLNDFVLLLRWKHLRIINFFFDNKIGQKKVLRSFWWKSL